MLLQRLVLPVQMLQKQGPQSLCRTCFCWRPPCEPGARMYSSRGGTSGRLRASGDILQLGHAAATGWLQPSTVLCHVIRHHSWIAGLYRCRAVRLARAYCAWAGVTARARLERACAPSTPERAACTGAVARADSLESPG